MKLKLIGLAFLAVVAFSCGSQPKSRTEAALQRQEDMKTKPAAAGKSLSDAPPASPPKELKVDVATSPAELEAGKLAYADNCAKCHKLFEPKEFSRRDWAPILVRMQKKAHLTDAQMAPITNYIYTQL